MKIIIVDGGPRPTYNTGTLLKETIRGVTKSNIHPWFDESGILHVEIYDFLLKDEYLE